jgi:hypothetical protein
MIGRIGFSTVQRLFALSKYAQVAQCMFLHHFIKLYEFTHSMGFGIKPAAGMTDTN